MPKVYVNINDKIFHDFDPTHNYTHNTYIYNLPSDFIKSDKDKYIIIRKLRMFNQDGQMELGACLTSDILSKICCYNYGINFNQNYIMSTNEINEKVFKITSDIKNIKPPNAARDLNDCEEYEYEKINI